MRTHIFTALMALFLAACASHHRDVASVENQDQDFSSATGRSEHAVLDGMSAGGGGSIR